MLSDAVYVAIQWAKFPFFIFITMVVLFLIGSFGMTPDQAGEFIDWMKPHVLSKYILSALVIFFICGFLFSIIRSLSNSPVIKEGE